MKNHLFTKTDLLYTIRLLLKKPGFTLLSILVLAGGLGVSIIAFTFSYTMFFKPLPITNGKAIFHVCAGPKNLGCRPLDAFDFAQFRDDITALENVGMYQEMRLNIDYQGTHIADRVIATEWNIFQLSQTNALLGRTLQAYDHEPNAEPVVVLGYGYWQLYFNGGDSAVGNTLNVNGVPARIVGIMPEGYLFPWAAQIWLPVTQAVLDPINDGFVQINTFGLLKAGRSEESADAEIANLMARTRQLYPSEFSGDYQSQTEYLDQLDTGHIGNFTSSEFSATTKFIMIAAIGTLTGFIFLLACINVGTLLLARTNERLKDISVRVALGAPRKRLLIQIMGESVAISIIGGILAVLLAGVFLETINVSLSSIGDGSLLAFWQTFHVDISTLLGVLLFISITILFTSVIPSWRLINGDFNAVMRDGTRGSVGLKPGRFSQSLVVTSIAIITLLLFVGTMAAAFALKIGRNAAELGASNIIAAQPELLQRQYDDGQLQQFYRDLNILLLQEPSIDNVLTQGRIGRLNIEREDAGGEDAIASVEVFGVSGSLETLGATLLEGRLLNSINTREGIQTAVISRSLADRLWPSQSPIDRSIRVLAPGEETGGSLRRVVGVISNVVDESQLYSQNLDSVYLPLSQTESVNAVVLAKVREGASSNLSNATSFFSQSILALEPSLDFVRVVNIEQQYAPLTQIIQFAIRIAIGSSVFSFLVAIAGIFGLTQNSIRLATQEIGTRRALGATDAKIGRTFLERGGKQVLLGFVLAMLLAFPFTYVSILVLGWGFVVTTLWSVIIAMVLLYVAVMLAIYYPLGQVLRLEPIESLRYE